MWHAAVVLLLTIAAPSRTFTLQAALERCHREQPFQTILLLQHKRQQPCHQLQQVAANATWPILQFNNEADFYLKSSQNSEMLAMICATGNYKLDREMWQAMARNLYNMRQVRLLLLFQQKTEIAKEQLKMWTDIADEIQLPNVLLLTEKENFYRLQAYAQNSWLKLMWHNHSYLFEKQCNYQQKVAYTLPDQITSLSLVYWHKKKKNLQLTGFVARLIEEFTRVYNISLRWQRPVFAGEEMSIILLRNMTLNGTLNLPITLCGFEPVSKLGIFSYPYDIPSWFIMVPCAREVAISEVFRLLFNWQMLVLLSVSYCLFILLDNSLSCLLLKQKFNWTNLLCNERMIAGILGQSSKLWTRYTITSRITQAQLFIVGLMISTVFAAHLKTLLTKRPTEKQISTFPQLRDSKLRVYFEQDERFYINRMTEDSSIHWVRSKIEYLPANDFYAQRKSLSVPQGFSITQTEWNMIRRQQELFQQPAFCYFPELIFRYNLLMSVPLEANSIYAQTLDLFIHHVHSSGLLLYWKTEALRDLIALGQISLEDPYEYESFHEFKVADLLVVWLTLCLGLVIGTLVFICESIAHHWNGKAARKIYLN